MSSKKRARGDTEDSQSEHIKRPPNAFLLFRSQFSKDYHSLHPGIKFKQGRHISPVAAEIWKQMPTAQKETYREQARVIKGEHERKYPGWRCRLKRAPKKGKQRSDGVCDNGVTGSIAGKISLDESRKWRGGTSKSAGKGDSLSGRDSSVARPRSAAYDRPSEIQLPVVGFFSSEVALEAPDLLFGSPASCFPLQTTRGSPHRIDSTRAAGTATHPSLDGARNPVTPPIDVAVAHPQYLEATDVAPPNLQYDVHMPRPFSSSDPIEYPPQYTSPVPWHAAPYHSHHTPLPFSWYAYDHGVTHTTSSALNMCSQAGVHCVQSLTDGGDENYLLQTVNTLRSPQQMYTAPWASAPQVYQNTSQPFSAGPDEPCRFSAFEQHRFERERPLRDATNVGVLFSRIRDEFDGWEEEDNIELASGSPGHPYWR